MHVGSLRRSLDVDEATRLDLLSYKVAEASIPDLSHAPSSSGTPRQPAASRETVDVVDTTSTLMGPEEVAQRLDVSVERVWSLAASGKLRSVAGHWPPRFRRVDVVEFAALEQSLRGSVRGRDKQVDDAELPPHAGGLHDAEELSLAAAARLLGVSAATVRRRIIAGELPTEPSRRVRRSDLDDFIARQRIRSGDLDHLGSRAVPQASVKEIP